MHIEPTAPFLGGARPYPRPPSPPPPGWGGAQACDILFNPFPLPGCGVGRRWVRPARTSHGELGAACRCTRVVLIGVR